MRKYFLLFTFLFSLLKSYSQTVNLDPSFGKNGMAKTDFGADAPLNSNNGHKILQKGDGTYYVLIDMHGITVIMHYLANGTLDIGYGNKGYSEQANITPNDAALQSDGKMVAAGWAVTANGAGFGLVRYNPDGSLDASFGTNGIISTPFNYTDEGGNIYSDAYVHSVTIQKDGKILAVGEAAAANGYSIAIARYNGGGSLDASFGSKGIVTKTLLYTDQESGDTYADASAYAGSLQSDGKIVVAGASGGHFLLARFNTNGAADNSFGTKGIVTPSFTGIGDADAYALSIQSDGKMVAAGSATTGDGLVMALARFNTNGTVDISFATNGIATKALFYNDAIRGTSSEALVLSINIQGDGKILALGDAKTDNGYALVLDRYNTNGLLDNTFANSGMLITSFNGTAYAYSACIQNDGKMLATGSFNDKYFILARFNSNGTLDTPFGKAGVVQDFIKTGTSNFSETVLQKDGKLVAAGTANTGHGFVFALARYNGDGSIDNTFGKNGTVTTSFNGSGYSGATILAVAIQTDGKIVAAGHGDNSNGGDVVLARYNTNGSLDASFGRNGIVITSIAMNGVASNAVAYSIILQNDGKMVAAGRAETGNGSSFALIRYNSNGTLDNTFGKKGIATTSFNTYPYAAVFALSIQKDGKIVAAGDGGNQSDRVFAVARYLSDGSLDNSFGKSGTITTPFYFSGNNYSDGSASSVSLQSDGKIIVGGGATGFNDGGYGFNIARYNSNGSLDKTFGTNGTIITAFYFNGTPYFIANSWSMAIQNDGKILAAGVASNNNGNALALARYTPAGSLDNSFGASGTTSTSTTIAISNTFITPDRVYAIGSATYYGDISALAAFKYQESTLITLHTGSLSKHSYCPGTTVQVPYTVTGTYASGNTFTAQLSDASGRFATPVTIGKVTATVSGAIKATIPAGAKAGAAYRIRVISSNPAVIGSDNGSNITINTLPAVKIPDAFALSKGVAANTVYMGYTPAASIVLTPTISAGSNTYSYKWSTGATTASISVSPAITTTYSVTVTDATTTCSNTTTLEVKVMDVRCGNKGDKVQVCRQSSGNFVNTQLNCIAPAAVAAHLANGAYLGSCATKNLTINSAINTIAGAAEDISGLSLRVLPNPSRTSFGLQLNSNDDEQVTIRIMDAVGRVVEERKAAANGMVQVGASYRPGIYYAQVIQGAQKAVVKLIKQSE